MGQQQIFLILVVTVIAGVATVIAINTLQDSRTQANIDAVKLDMLETVPVAAAYFNKPDALGGGGGTFKSVRMSDILLDSVNENGSYAISNRQDGSFLLEGTPQSQNETLQLQITDQGGEWVNN